MTRSTEGGRARWGFLLGATALSAVLLALYGRVASPWFALGFVALVPWLLALDRARSWAESLAVGAALNVAFVISVLAWLPAAAARYSSAPPAVTWLVLIVVAPLLQPQFLAFTAARRLVGRPRRVAALAGALAWVGVEIVVGKLFGDTLGQGLYPSRALRQGADLVGVHGLTLLLLLVNEAFVTAIRRRAERARPTHVFKPLLGALGLIAAAVGYGQFRVHQLDAQRDAPSRVIGVVQANITNYDKLRAEKGAFETVRTILDTHMALSEEISARAKPDLLIWPETVYPTTFGAPKSEAGAAFDDELIAFARSRGVPLVFGGFDAEGDREFNAAFFLTAAREGWVSTAKYRKGMLFPFTERIPGALDSAWLRNALPWTGHWASGPGPKTIELRLRDGKPLTVVPLICYDVVFPSYVAEAASAGADLIVTLSNDSWFPDDRAPRHHLVAAAFRSVETRLPQVRATNSGISALIAPSGDIVAETRWDARETLAASLAMERRSAPAVTLGPWLGPLSLLAALLLSVRAVVQRSRRAAK